MKKTEKKEKANEWDTVVAQLADSYASVVHNLSMEQDDLSKYKDSDDVAEHAVCIHGCWMRAKALIANKKIDAIHLLEKRFGDSMSANEFKAVTEKISKMHDETVERLDAVRKRVTEEQTKQYARAWVLESCHDGFGALEDVKGISERAANEVFDLLVSRADERTDLEADGEERLRQIGHYLEESLDPVLSAVAVALKAYQMASNPQKKSAKKAM